MKLLKYIPISIASGVLLPIFVHLFFILNNDPQTMPNYLIAFIFFVGLILGASTSIISDTKGPFINWSTYSSFAHNDKLSIFILLFSITPLIVKTANLVQLEKHLTPIFYAYWLCGLSLLLFVSLFKLISPKVYRYANYEQFKLESNSIATFREAAYLALKSIEKREANYKLHQSEKFHLKQDKIFLEKVVCGKKVLVEDAYAILGKRLSHHNNIGIHIVFIFILLPAFIFPLVFMANIYLVFTKASSSFPDGTSYLNILLGG